MDVELHNNSNENDFVIESDAYKEIIQWVMDTLVEDNQDPNKS